MASGKLDNIGDAALRERLVGAHQMLRKGKATDAVRELSDAFLGMLRDHPELLDKTVPMRGMQMPIVMRWPALGANLVPESVREKAPRIEFVRDRFAMSEAITYYEFTVDTALSQGN